MNLIDYLKDDLLSLFQHNKVQRAANLNTALQRSFISENCIPMYFTGKKDARTVMVMLNPGYENPNYSFKNDPHSQNISFEDFINQHIEDHIHYGKKFRSDKIDAFDLKQAAFLMPFTNSGIDLPDFIEEPNHKLNAQVNVLTQKLQLELIPYCSKEFGGVLDTAKQALKNIEPIIPYLESVLDSITAYPRQYVVFCAKQFIHLLAAYQRSGRGEVIFGKMISEKIDGLKKKVYFNSVVIHYKGKTLHAGVACSFPRRDLPNAYAKMRAYGQFCYRQMHTSNT